MSSVLLFTFYSLHAPSLFFLCRRAPCVGCQDHEFGPRGHREATREGASWLARSLRQRGGNGHAEPAAATAVASTGSGHAHECTLLRGCSKKRDISYPGY